MAEEFVLTPKKILSDVADAIREKGGTTDPILAEGLAAAIAEIEAGCEWRVASGAITLAQEQELSTTDPWKIPHGLGKKPVFALVYTGRQMSSTGRLCMAAYVQGSGYMADKSSGLSYSESFQSVNFAADVYPSIAKNLSNSLGCNCDENDIKVFGYGTNKVGASMEYFWLAGVKA